MAKCLKISQKLHGGDRKHIKVCKKNLKINRWVIFHPYANFNCPYLKTGLCDLFPILLECITYTQTRHVFLDTQASTEVCTWDWYFLLEFNMTNDLLKHPPKRSNLNLLGFLWNYTTYLGKGSTQFQTVCSLCPSMLGKGSTQFQTEAVKQMMHLELKITESKPMSFSQISEYKMKTASSHTSQRSFFTLTPHDKIVQSVCLRLGSIKHLCIDT